MSSEFEKELAEYDHPPVVEVAASVQFRSIDTLDAVKLSQIWARFRDRFPGTDIHAALDHVIEGSSPLPGQSPPVSIQSSFPIPRLWFLSEDRTQLIQIQRDRLVVNWRQLDRSTPYLRYAGLRDLLIQSLHSLSEFLREEGHAGIVPNQAELTYVNHIEAADERGQRRYLSDFLLLCAQPPADSDPGTHEETSFKTQYKLKYGADAVARLYIEVQSGYKDPDAKPVYLMNLVARGAPKSPDVDSAIEFLDWAHRLIVSGFTEITTPSSHQEWGLRVR